jgi:diguanylate cyclase (GGDEF)-like protein
MNYLAIPSFLGLTWMALVLLRVHDPRASQRLRLWVAGLALIQAEAVARFFYTLPTVTGSHHLFAHAAALDCYFLAGVVFLRSSGTSASRVAAGRWYLLLSAVPHLVLLTCYGMDVRPAAIYVSTAAAGVVLTPVIALRFGKTRGEALAQSAMWLLLLGAACDSHRLAAYLSLTLIYGITAAAFALRLNRNSRGRVVVAASFAMWAACFVLHPWLAEHHASWVPMLSQVWDLQRYLVTFGVLIYALEERVAVNEYLALHDALTGLANRNLFENRLQAALARARRRGTRVLLLNLDMSGFKAVNDCCGHPAGDQLLRQIAQRLRTATRESDTVARLGGDEFSLILEDVDAGLLGLARPDSVAVRCEALVAKFREAVEARPFLLAVAGGERVLPMEVAIGSATFPDDADTVQELHRQSDESMYRDKRRLREMQPVVAAG